MEESREVKVCGNGRSTEDCGSSGGRNEGGREERGREVGN